MLGQSSIGLCVVVIKFFSSWCCSHMINFVEIINFNYIARLFVSSLIWHLIRIPVVGLVALIRIFSLLPVIQDLQVL